MILVRLFTVSALALLIVATGCVRDDGVTPTPIPTAESIPPPTSTVLPSPTPVPSPTPRVVLYTVEQGDTLLSIAQQYGVTVEDIVEANPDIENPDLLQIGQEIRIPLPEED